MRNCLKKQKLWMGLTILVGTIDAVFSIFTAIILQKLIDLAINYNGKDYSGLIYRLLGVIIYFIFAVLCYYEYKHLLFKVTYKISELYRIAIYTGICKRDYKSFYDQNTSDYISNLTNEINIVTEDYILSIFEIFNNLLLFISTTILIVYYNKYIAVAMLISLILMIVLPNLFSSEIEKRKVNYTNELSNFTNEVKDTFSGYEILKCYNVLSIVVNKIIFRIEKLEKDHFKSQNIISIVSSLSYLLANITQIIILFMGIYFVTRGDMTVGAVVALIQLSGTFINPIVSLVESYSSIKSAIPIVKKLDKLSDVVSDVEKKNKSLTFNNVIKLDQLSFKYSQQDDYVLRNISFEIYKNKKYVIIGKNGCGKSTLLKLICGYFNDYEGKILFDGIELRKVDKKSISNLISVVHQSIYLFNTNIIDNISLFIDFSETDVKRAIEISGSESFIQQLNDGLYSKVEENGANFSGGQKQRIAMARAIIKKSPILFLDEGMSAVDSETGQEIENKLLNMETITLLSITHSFNENILRKYDTIIYMENGEISEMGSYEDLISIKSKFYEYMSTIT